MGTGQPQYHAILEELEAVTNRASRKSAPACFTAGTLVHTKEGLRPIEQIKVGDWLLSKHESGEGERAYKRVTNTFVHEHREVIRLSVRAFEFGVIDQYWTVIVTPEHPIWVEGRGWTEARKLKQSIPTMYLESLLHENVRVGGNVRLFATGIQNVAWLPLSSAKSDLQRLGPHLNVRTLETVARRMSRPFKSVQGLKPEDMFRTTVYSFEVEDFHTYYVGEVGIWVHNKNISVKGGTPLGAKLA